MSDDVGSQPGQHTERDESGQRKHSGPQHDGPARTSPYPVSRLAAPHDLVDLAEQIKQADVMLQSVVGGKLEQIAKQITALQDEAREALAGARRDAELHRVACSMRKRPGKTYHLYERQDGHRYFSMLSPEEWGGAPPHRHEGSYRLEYDMAWTPLSEVAARDERRRTLRAVLPADPT